MTMLAELVSTPAKPLIPGTSHPAPHSGLEENIDLGDIDFEALPPSDDPFALAMVVPPLRSESSVSPGFNLFGDMTWPGELPKPVIHRTPEELGIPSVVADVRPPRPNNLRPDDTHANRTTIARAGAKKDKPRPRTLSASTLEPHHQAAPVLTHSSISVTNYGLNLNSSSPAQKGTAMTITEEKKQAIRDSDPERSCREVGEDLGLGQSVVQYYRTKFANGAKTPKPAKAAKARTTPSLKSEIVIHKSRPVTLLVNDKIVEAWWKQLSLDKKAELFAGNYVIRLEGAVA